jgi:carboxyl-terminal processing protease
MEFFVLFIFIPIIMKPMPHSSVRPAIIMITLLLCSCLYGYSGGLPVIKDTMELPCLQKAEKLLDEALNFMEKNYYRKDQVSWTSLAAEAKSRLKNAGDCDDAYGSITWCFSQLNEPHSFVMAPDKAARYTNDAASLSQDLSTVVGEIKGEWLQDSIAYLTIPWVSTDDSLICERVADSLQSVIATLDTRRISRWIIDLRKNSGGNCWPMLAGIGPLLGDGVYGYFVSSGERMPITYQAGSAFQGRHVRCRVSREGYRTQCPRKSIVVLTGRRTVSAGEIVALAFKGREQTYLYGEPTAGLTTANATYSLSDRSMLVLTVCQEADHTGRICTGSIQPDKMITASEQSLQQDDPVKTAAISWLMTQ